MESLANYKIIADNREIIVGDEDDPGRGTIDFFLPTNALVVAPSILSFNLHLDDPDDLLLKILATNESDKKTEHKKPTEIFRGSFNSNVMRNVQLVVPGSTWARGEVKEIDENLLTFIKRKGDGVLRFSSVVLWYHATA